MNYCIYYQNVSKPILITSSLLCLGVDAWQKHVYHLSMYQTILFQVILWSSEITVLKYHGLFRKLDSTVKWAAANQMPLTVRKTVGNSFTHMTYMSLSLPYTCRHRWLCNPSAHTYDDSLPTHNTTYTHYYYYGT